MHYLQGNARCGLLNVHSHTLLVLNQLKLQVSHGDKQTESLAKDLTTNTTRSTSPSKQRTLNTIYNFRMKPTLNIFKNTIIL